MDTWTWRVLTAVWLCAVAGAPPSRIANQGPDLYIVDGDKVNIKSVPYQVGVELLLILNCGGSVLSERWVLTAGHCVYGLPTSLIRVRAGSSLSFVFNPFMTVSRVRRGFVHPRYDSAVVDYDVGLLQLARPLKLSASIRPVALPRAGEEPRDGLAVVSGWGVTWEGGLLTTFMLRRVAVRITEREACKRINNYTDKRLTPRMICAGGQGAGDSCQGDSGGPLVLNGRQVGIVSWGDGCNRPDHSGVYTNVAHPEIREFIWTTTGV